MSETVNNLVDAIKSGDALATEQAFAAAMAEKLSAKIDDMRQAVASNMFDQPEPVAEVSEGYRGNSEADKPFFDAQDHKKAAEKARKSGDHFSYHKHMSAHHDAMEHWSNNKGRIYVANQHAMKADEHEDYAHRLREDYAQQAAEEVEQIDEISLDTMKSAKEKLGHKAIEAHYDDNKRLARHYAQRALSMGSKIKRKEWNQRQSNEEVVVDDQTKVTQ